MKKTPASNRSCVMGPHTNKADPLNLANLPPEILNKVFSYLPNVDIIHGVGMTCQSFYRLTRSPDMWTTVTVSYDRNPERRDISERRCLEMLGQTCLTNRDCEAEQGQSSSGLGRNPVRNGLTVRHVVKAVKEDYWNLRPTRTCSITGGMFYPNLQQLSLKWDSLSPLRPTFLTKYSNLLRLDLDGGRGYKYKSLFEHLFKALKALTKLQTLKLKFDRLYKPSDAGAASAKNYFHCGPKLMCVSLKFALTDDIVEDILLHCSLLEQLELGAQVTAEAFRAASRQPSLSVSSLTLENVEMSNKLLRFASKAFPSLKKLCVTDVRGQEKTGRGATYLMKRCPRLTHLELESSFINDEDYKPEDDDEEEEADREELGDGGLDPENQSLLSGLVCEQSHKCLQVLKLRRVDLSLFSALVQIHGSLHTVKLYECTRLHEGSVLAMLKHCPGLQTIEILKCQAICVHTKAVSALWTLPYLQTLKVDHACCVGTCPQSRDDPPRRKRKLESWEPNQEVDIGRLQKVALLPSSLLLAPSGLELFERTCHGLQSLGIYEDHLIDDDSLRVILRCCVYLRKLKVERTSIESARPGKLTVVGLRHLQNYGQGLQRLKLTFNIKFTTKGLTDLLVCSPALLHFTYILPENERFSSAESGRISSAFHFRRLKKSVESKMVERWGGRRVVEAWMHDSCLFSAAVSFRIFKCRGCDNMDGDARRLLKASKRMTSVVSSCSSDNVM